MQNKGAITLLTIALALVSLYQLSFTWKTNRVEKVAREYAQGDPVKEKVYLDSIANKEVYNFLGIAQYTYKECKELELNLGLDLRGGMNVTMEVDVVDVVRSLANYSQDEAFNQALQEAVKMRTSSPKDFVTLFGEAFERIAPNAQLASPNIFGTVELKDKIKIGASNKEDLDVIRQEAEGAIDNTFNILRTRIDRFGVAQPNIRKADISGRIVIELPGIKDAQRVRKLLQGTAALEFYETFDNGDFFPYLQAANEKARTIVEAEEILTTENAANATAEQPETAQADTTANSLISQAAAQDSTNNLLADEAAFKKANPLFSVLTPNIDRQSGQIIPTGSLICYSYVKDTAAGFIAIAESDKTIGEEINIATQKEISIGDLANEIISQINPKAQIVCDEQRLRPEKSEVNRLLGCNEKIKRLTDWQPQYTFAQGITETIDWIKKNMGAYKTDIYNV